jgi:hypothetical protein
VTAARRVTTPEVVTVRGMTVGTIWVVLTIVNAVIYVWFIRSRGEAGTGSTVVMATFVSLIFGPLVWCVWLSQRAGRNHESRGS